MSVATMIKGEIHRGRDVATRAYRAVLHKIAGGIETDENDRQRLVSSINTLGLTEEQVAQDADVISGVMRAEKDVAMYAEKLPECEATMKECAAWFTDEYPKLRDALEQQRRAMLMRQHKASLTIQQHGLKATELNELRREHSHLFESGADDAK